ncbi:hypothetical protein VTO42DRAFT_8568 [Malbranchea cinnamomea]
MGDDMMVYLFGKKASGDVATFRNGLWLPWDVADEFNKHRRVFVPATTPTKSVPQEWKTVLLYPENQERNLGQFKGKKLQFRNDQRPRACYVFFRFILAMVHFTCTRRDSKCQRNQSAITDSMVVELWKTWGDEGKYLCENFVRGLIDLFGHDIPTDVANEMLKHSFSRSNSDDFDKLSDVIQDMEDEIEFENESNPFWQRV